MIEADVEKGDDGFINLKTQLKLHGISHQNISRNMITPQNFMRHEFIGLPVEVVDASHEGFKGIKGKVVDETKNTIKIEDDAGKEKVIPKKVATFHFTLPKGTIVEIEGNIIVARPEDRIKKRFRKY